MIKFVKLWFIVSFANLEIFTMHTCRFIVENSRDLIFHNFTYIKTLLQYSLKSWWQSLKGELRQYYARGMAIGNYFAGTWGWFVGSKRLRSPKPIRKDSAYQDSNNSIILTRSIWGIVSNLFKDFCLRENFVPRIEKNKKCGRFFNVVTKKWCNNCRKLL